MNKLLYPLFALSLTVGGNLLLAQSAAAMDDMDKGSMTMQRMEGEGMGNGAMMKQDKMQHGTMKRDAMKNKDHDKMRKHDKQMKKDKMMKKDRMMKHDKMKEDKMERGSMQRMQ